MSVTDSVKNPRVQQILSYIAPVITFLLMVWGAYVSAIEASLACPDWPLCNGQLIPDLSDPLIFAEFVHRLIAVFVLIVILLLFLVAFINRAQSNRLFIVTVLMTVFVLVQIPLGGIMVILDLEDLLEVSHLATALLVYSFSIINAVWARDDLKKS
ncbi:MAG: COX15/CtaA family protein [Candidatus Odinarchaeota archaeon]